MLLMAATYLPTFSYTFSKCQFKRNIYDGVCAILQCNSMRDETNLVGIAAMLIFVNKYIFISSSLKCDRISNWTQSESKRERERVEWGKQKRYSRLHSNTLHGHRSQKAAAFLFSLVYFLECFIYLTVFTLVCLGFGHQCCAFLFIYFIFFHLPVSTTKTGQTKWTCPP